MNAIQRCFIALILSLLPFWAWAEPLDINSATAEQLATTIVGVGKAKAAAIVKDREANGPFKSVDDLGRVKGIGKKTLEANKDKLTVKSEPPSATKASPAPQPKP